MNIPNMLTMARIVMTVFFVILMQGPSAAGAFTAFGLFILACLTDLADGYIARKYNMITVFGKIMDPLADKVLTLSALLLLAMNGMVVSGFVLIVALREVSVTAVRLQALATGRVLPAEASGKIKTVFQMSAIILALMIHCALRWEPTAVVTAKFYFPLAVFINGVMMIAVLLTVISGAAFFKNLSTKGLGSGE